MKERILSSLLSMSMLTLFLFTACTPREGDNTTQRTRDDTPAKSFTSDGVEIEILNAERLDSYQTHYIMTYPPQGEQFVRIEAAINGTDQPESWGNLNLSLSAENEVFSPVHARRVLIGEDYEYTADENFRFHYQFFFSVPESINLRTLSLLIQEKHTLPLADMLQSTHRYSQDTSSTPSSGEFSVVAGGSSNAALATHSTVSGGQYNIASVAYASVGGGRENQASYLYSTVSGGYGNVAAGRESSVCGGSRNTAEGDHSISAGGIQNQAVASDSVVSGGAYNTAEEVFATVGGGTRNIASGTAAVVSGGAGNESTGSQSSISGGLGNRAAGNYSAIIGGHQNQAGGDYSATLGGFGNHAQANFSIALGHTSRITADHPGTFLYTDSLPVPFYSENPNEFAVRATGGMRIVNAVDLHGNTVSGVVLLPGSGSWETLSSRDTKTNIEAVHSHEILEELMELPLYTWSYRGDPASAIHLGPTAEDFKEQFDLGASGSTIATVDADGVALAAIQAAGQKIQRQHAMLLQQEARLELLEADLRSLQHDKSKLKSTSILFAALILSQIAFPIIYHVIKERIRLARYKGI